MIIIAFLIVIVYDYLDFPREFLSRLYSFIFKVKVTKEEVDLPKLLDCSLCATFWSCLVYGLCTGGGLISTAFYSLLTALFTPYILLSVELIDSALRGLFYTVKQNIEKSL